MKVVHTSDWHLGQQFYEHSRFAEHQAFLDWLCQELVQVEADLLIVSGDIYHTATPPAAAEQQLYTFIKHAKIALPNLHIVIVAGNHDSANRIETAKPLLYQFDTHVIGRFDKHKPEDVVKSLMTSSGKINVIAMPFLRSADISHLDSDESGYGLAVEQAYQSAYACIEDENLAVIAMGHLHAKGGDISSDSERNITIGGFDSIHADVFGDVPDYVALGHLHKAQKVANNDCIRYCGTPMPMSFAERHYKHQVLLVEFEGSRVKSVSPRYVPRYKEIILLPEKGGATLAQLCDAIETLELPTEDEPKPYLRLRLNANETDSQFRHKIEQALENKAVHFCGIERVSLQMQQGDELLFEDLGKVSELAPKTLLELAYKEQIDAQSTLPSALEKCLEEVLVSLSEQEKS
ncbi:exonuclease SbcCD subunit D C-terminal domain-containing protein [Pseudoalteromonas luteoviolacea]|uniref:exonuclease SbcCD subunit D C-terminal domain-containing protein n=1 Tax=Pseudoalteromonas luteoviolacea TaxID=43657 RepID=UPI001154EC4B|nr:exonuclease SbcCD subunit D C-terminal domain-containing protein [Pseudoalteromonas luteoviolacea]TQF68099.1 exonuclease subunit SbcD [Pseudoalteromonas luteoviolacea]